MLTETPQAPSEPTPAPAQAAPAAASPTSQTPATGAAQGQPAGAAASASQPSRPSWMPEAFWDAEKSAPKEKEFGEHIAGLEKLKTDGDTRRAAVPAKAEDYKVDLGDMKLPPGSEIDQKNPTFLELRDFAHKAGWTGDEFGKVLQTYVKDILSKRADGAAQFTQAIAARNTALGENGAERASKLETWIDAGWTDKAQANQIKGSIAISPVVFKAMEELQAFRSNQGVHGMTQTGREPAGPNDWKPENWDKLSSVDRLVLTRAHGREKAAA
jgi:hypothetical protein